MLIGRNVFVFGLLCALGCGSDSAVESDFRSGATNHVSSLAEFHSALSGLSAGDEIVIVAGGDYGSLHISGRSFSSETTIRAASGVRATFDRVRVTNCSQLVLSNIHVRPTSKTSAVVINGGDSVSVVDSDIGFADHAVGWTASDWQARMSTGIRVLSTSNVVVRGNDIHHVKRGVDTDGLATDINGNRINYFSDDGVRVHGDDSTVRSNRITNNVKVDGSTNVGIQSVSRGPSGNAGGGRVDGLLVWGNTILESTDPGKPFGAPLQGIGFYDGIYGDLMIAQNLVSVDGWRGIVVFGGEKVNVQYNTVVDAVPSTSRRPDVTIADHKNGTPSTNARLRYNIASRVGSNGHVSSYSNHVVSAGQYGNTFEDHENFDFTATSAVPANRGAEHYRPLGGSLREAAARHGVVAGGGLASFMCSPQSTDDLCDIASTEYDLVVPTNALKWQALRPTQSDFDFSRGDTQVAFAERNGQQVHGHTLLWSTSLPQWLEQYRGNGAALGTLMDQHIQTVVSHYRDQFPGTVTRWDVVNEAFESSGALRGDSIWAAVDAGIGPAEYIKRAFRVAHAADPQAHLVLNDFRVEFGAKGDAMFALVSEMRAEGVPVHGVGFQSHYNTGASTNPTGAQLREMMQRYAAIGVDVHITELDVRMPIPVDAAKLTLAHSLYQRVVDACFAEPNCKTLTAWSISGLNAWITEEDGYSLYHAFAEDLRAQTPYWILRAGQ